MTENKTKRIFCKVCEKRLLGRIDKKFCSSACRAEWHNEWYRKDQKEVRRVNGILSKNRKILQTLHLKNQQPDRKILDFLHFNLDYHTHLQQTKDLTIVWSYDFGIALTEDDHYEIYHQMQPEK